MGAREFPVFSTRIHPDVKTALLKYARATGRRQTWIVEAAIREWLERNPR